METYRFAVDSNVSTHSRPKAAGRIYRKRFFHEMVSTHSRPKAAGAFYCVDVALKAVSTHSRPKAAGSIACVKQQAHITFQHTAARRRLDMGNRLSFIELPVSTHSRPKAAGDALSP